MRNIDKAILPYMSCLMVAFERETLSCNGYSSPTSVDLMCTLYRYRYTLGQEEGAGNDQNGDRKGFACAYMDLC